MMRVLVVLVLVMLVLTGAASNGILKAADQAQITRAALARLSEEADAFRRIAPSLLGSETLDQKARKAPPRFRPRVGDAAKTAPPPVWQDRQVVSEYAFVELAGDTQTLHEIRKVQSVDGKPLAAKKGEESLARIISMNDDQRERELLKEFTQYGLSGAAIDFGPLLMLFTPREIEHYEFNYKNVQMFESTPVVIFRFVQIDGPDLITIFRAESKNQPHHVKVQGEVWFRQDNYLPLRITLAVGDGQGSSTVREEATVNYESSKFGALVPASVEHKELLGGQLSVQNSFIYREFHRFAADSEIKF